MQKSTLAKLAQIVFFISCGISVLVTLLPWWPKYNLLIIPKYILLFGPRWWLFIVVLLAFFFWPFLVLWQKRMLFLLLLLSFNYVDFQLPQLWKKPSTSQTTSLKIITYNIGGGGSEQELQLLVKYLQPDILLIQEANRVNISRFNSNYFSECVSGLCILSKFPFQRMKALPRKIFGGWGSFAIFYRITTDNGNISLANVHLETPRSVLMGVLYRDFDQHEAQKIENNRQLEIDLLSLWAKSNKAVLIAGDFNMTVDENIYNHSFAQLNNAVDVKGLGFYRTKYTSWYGARIDHILFSDDFTISQVKVIKLLHGDHRPLMATLAY